MEGGWGFGVSCTFNSSFSQMCYGTLLESSCSHARIRAEEVAMMKMPDFPVLQRDIAPGAAAQVDVLVDFWQADPHGKSASMEYGEASDHMSSSCCQLILPGDMSSSKDDMGLHSDGTRTCLVWSCLSARDLSGCR